MADQYRGDREWLRSTDRLWRSDSGGRDLDLTLTFYQFAPDLHRHIRTTNHLERLFREFRTKSDEIGAFPHETSCLTVFFLVIEQDHAKHDRKAVAKNS